MAESIKRFRGKDLKFWNKKLQEKFKEALTAVLPIIAIVLVLSFTIAPITPSILLCFLMGALMVIVGMMFFTLGAETSMTPMGEAVGLRNVEPPTRPRLECLRETGLILRCDRKVGNPFQIGRASCRERV